MPKADRPHMPDGYGVPATDDNLLGWDGVEARLLDSAVYWMATTRPGGRPHVVPRWGAWLDGRLWYDGSPDTIHARNLAANPACVLHLEDGTKAVIVEGTAAPSVPVTGDIGARLSAEFGRKYADLGYAPAPDAWSGPGAGGLLVFVPVKTMAWTEFPTDVTRFHH